MINSLYEIYEFINDQKEKVLQSHQGWQVTHPDDIQKYSDMLKCAEIGILTLAETEITNSNTIFDMPLEEVFKIIHEYRERKSKPQMDLIIDEVHLDGTNRID